jgi:hypothetical protein
VEHTRHRGVWDLRIKSVRKEDEGIYECNLSLHPPESIFISVSVVGECDRENILSTNVLREETPHNLLPPLFDQ